MCVSANLYIFLYLQLFIYVTYMTTLRVIKEAGGGVCVGVVPRGNSQLIRNGFALVSLGSDRVRIDFELISQCIHIDFAMNSHLFHILFALNLLEAYRIRSGFALIRHWYRIDLALTSQ